MTFRRSRRVALLLSTVLAAGAAAPALAQSGSPHPLLDTNGVDLIDGSFNLRLPIASIGSGAAELALIATDGQRDNWSAMSVTQTLSGSTIQYAVSLGLQSDNFTSASASSTRGTGATLTVNPDNSLTYKSLDGVRILFGNPAEPQGGASNLCDMFNNANCTLLAISVAGRSGMTANLNWDVRSQCSTIFNPDGSLDCNYFWRLTNISNSAGYSINWTYATDTVLLHQAPSAAWYRRTSASLSNTLVSGSGSRTVTYANPSTNVYTITTPGGKTWRINGSGQLITGVRRPSATADTTLVSYTGVSVNSVTRDGLTTSYNRTVSGNTATTVVTNAQSQQTTVVANMSIYRPVSVTDPLSRTTSYTYDTVGRPSEITFPEGNKVHYEYDGRGNVTETRLKAKAGSGLADIVTSASYPASCTTPSCNSPDTTTDARGNVVNYSYDPTTGLLTSVTLPAATSGANRPQTRYSYTINGAGVSQLTGVSQCQTGVAPGCVGTADEVKTTLAYDANANTTSATTAAGDNSLSATVGRTYDAAGNLLTVDGPLSGTADTVTYRYDADRQRLGMISPDPDGAGALKRRAVKTTYNADGQPTIMEAGNVDGTSDGDWAAFASAQQATSTYDANGFKTKDVVTAAGGTWQVTQYSYDTVGRLECTALRMNSATWGSLPGACTLATTGTAGPDRITRNSYDAAGRIAKVQTAYGTADQSDEVTSSYTNNGKLASVTDAEGNKTSYEYDGLDRLSITRYPVTTVAAGASSTTDYEQLGYDAASNVTSQRLRDGQSITYGYDNLNRVSGKTTPTHDQSVTWSVPHDWNVSYTYDLLGRLKTATGDGWAVNTFAYDALGRTTTEQYYSFATNHAYDLAGRQTRLTWNDGFYVDYDYNVAGDMTAIRENGATSGAGVLATYQYDNLGRRSSIMRGNGTTTNYGYDAVSRLASLTQDLSGSAYDFTHSFSYNPAGQIASLTRNNDTYAWAGHYNVDRSYGVNGLNQMTTAGATSLGYDGRGNLTSSGSAAYTYSTDNRMLSAPGVTMAYEPAAGQLLRFNTAGADTRFSWSGSQMISEYGTAFVINRRYVPGPGVDEPVVWYEGSGTSDRRWLHADERGSVVAVSDGSGNAIAINRYDEYGIPSSGNIGRFQYTGQAWLPELGMYYYKARIYSPTLGRFMQTDPIGYGAGLNVYNYVNSDPVNYRDPAGLDPEPLPGWPNCYWDPDTTTTTCGGDGGHPKDEEGVPWWYGTGGGNVGGGSGSLGGGVGGSGGINSAIVVRAAVSPQETPCGDSPDSALNIVRDGLDWLSVGADGLSIAATATGVGAPIGGLVKGLQIGLEIGIGGINAYDAYFNGNYAPGAAQLAGLGTKLIPGGALASRAARSLRGGQARNALGQFRRSMLDTAAGREAVDTGLGRAAGAATEGTICLFN